MVLVGPPLSFKPLGSSFGSTGDALVPTMSLLAFGFPAGKLVAAPSFLPIRLKPCEVKVPLTSGTDDPVVFKATMLLLIFTAPWLLTMPPPLVPELLLNVLLVMLNVPWLLKTPPPPAVAPLAERVLTVPLVATTLTLWMLLPSPVSAFPLAIVRLESLTVPVGVPLLMLKMHQAEKA